MVSAWWLLVAFVGGGLIGVLLIALMHIGGELPEPAQKLPDLSGRPQ